jgi:peptidylprolyl isomerase
MILMNLQKGDFIRIDFVAKVKETGEVFDTTYEETAKKEHLFKEGEIYEPTLVVIGEGWVLKPLEESLQTMEIGKTAVVEITPEKAFGPRDAEKVKRVHLKQLLAKGLNPTVGGRIEYGGKMATVRTIGAGRVLLDYNPPLAGKTLVYEVTIREKLESVEEKILALIHRRVPGVDQTKFTYDIKDETVDVEMPEDAFYVEGIQVAKRGIALDIQKFVPDKTTVKFTETFKTEPKPKIEMKLEKTEAKKETDKRTKAKTAKKVEA